MQRLTEFRISITHLRKALKYSMYHVIKQSLTITTSPKKRDSSLQFSNTILHLKLYQNSILKVTKHTHTFCSIYTDLAPLILTRSIYFLQRTASFSSGVERVLKACINNNTSFPDRRKIYQNRKLIQSVSST